MTLQRSLLILFVLLQCLSPLAHAHVDGVDAGRMQYSHDLDPYAYAGDTGMESETGAVITMSQAYPASDGPSVHHADLAPLVKPGSIDVTVTEHAPPARLYVSSIPERHILPWSQAPPLAR